MPEIVDRAALIREFARIYDEPQDVLEALVDEAIARKQRIDAWRRKRG